MVPGYTGTSSGFHFGVDYPCQPGQDVVAVCDAVVVTAAENQPVGYPGSYDGGWGTVVSLDVGDGMVLDYCHLRAAIVWAGQPVKAGQLLGSTGETGIPGVTVKGPHLHMQIRKGGARIDPTARLA